MGKHVDTTEKELETIVNECSYQEQSKDGSGTVTIVELEVLEDILHKIILTVRGMRWTHYRGTNVNDQTSNLRELALQCQEGIRGLLKLSTGCNRMVSQQKNQSTTDSTVPKSMEEDLSCHCFQEAKDKLMGDLFPEEKSSDASCAVCQAQPIKVESL